MIEESLNKIGSYFQSMGKDGDCKYVAVMFPDSKWVAEVDDIVPENIMVDEDENVNGYYIYTGTNSDVTMDMILDCVSKVVEFNVEGSKRGALFSEKFRELQEIFSDLTIPYEDLASLQFKCGDKVIKRKKKGNKVLTSFILEDKTENSKPKDIPSKSTRTQAPIRQAKNNNSAKRESTQRIEQPVAQPQPEPEVFKPKRETVAMDENKTGLNESIINDLIG